MLKIEKFIILDNFAGKKNSILISSYQEKRKKISSFGLLTRNAVQCMCLHSSTDRYNHEYQQNLVFPNNC